MQVIDGESADRLAIHELIGRYALEVDRRRIDAVADCFTDDARLEFTSDRRFLHGRAAIVEFYDEAFQRPALAGGASTHQMTGTVITFDGPDAATAVTEAIAWLAPHGAGRITVRGLTYTDRCVRTTEGWRFADRTHRLHWEGAIDGGPANDAG